MKRSMLILLAVLMLLLAPATQLRANAAETGTCGDDLTWTLDDTGILTISGTGAMYDYSDEFEVPWWQSHRESIQSVVVEDGVTNISDWAFMNCTNLSSVTIGKDVTSIGFRAFQGCINLSSISIPGNVATIGRAAFNGCTNLSSVTFGDGVTTIGDESFTFCTSLTSITFPDSVTTIDDWAFMNCENLSSVTFGKGVTTIGEWAFCECNLDSITIPDSVTTIVGTAFQNCRNLRSVTLGKGVTTIDAGTFMNCTSLSDIIIPESVTTIDDFAFYNCTALNVVHYGGTEEQKAEITIGSDNSSLEDAQWHYQCNGTNCPGLPPAIIGGTCGENLTWTLDDKGTLTISGTGAMDDYTYEGDKISSKSTAPWYSYREDIQSVVVEDGVTTIGDYAFYRCSSLGSITIPDSITSIGFGAFSGCTSLSSITIPDTVTSISASVFANCTSLSSITLPDSITIIGASVFADCTSLSSITLPDSITIIDFGAFSGCTSLSSITLPDSVNGIGEGAFSACTSLSSITIPNGVTFINFSVFYNCTNLSSITIPASVTTIDDSAFYNCTALSVVHYAGTEEEKAEISIGSDNSYLENAQWHYECNGTNCPELPPAIIGGTCGENLTWTLDDTDTLTISGTGAMYDYSPESHAPWYPYWESIQSVVLEDGVTSIGDYAFPAYWSLGSITIPDTVTDIGAYAFIGCTHLSSITIPDSVTTIGENAFYNCTGLTDVYYTGTEAQRAEISIGSGNSDLENAQWHYASAKENPFVDVAEDAYYFDPVLWAVENGITNGLDATHFGPNATCTRGQVVTFLWRASGCPQPKNTVNPFSDVNSGDYYYTAVLWAAEKGITTGLDASHFGPNATCTRGQVVTFLWRAQGKPASGGGNIFTDVAPGAYYYDAVLWAVENSIANGTGASTFAPNATCTRGQIVTFLYRAMK